MARQRERIRRKALVADSSTTLDLSNVEPMIPLKARGRKLWGQLAAETPYWWNAADIPTAMMLCVATDAVSASLTKGSANATAAIIKEWRSLAGELGLSPTSRGRLKLTEAQSTVASKRVEALEAERRKADANVIDIDDLINDG